MIRVLVLLDPGGKGTNITHLASVGLANEGTGSDTHADYKVCSHHKKTLKVLREAKVENHPRKSQPVLTLVRKALQAMGY